jgi:uncharacterized membrane protein
VLDLKRTDVFSSLKKYLLTGLVVWLPIAATLWVVQFVLHTVDDMVALLPSQYRPDYWLLEQILDHVPQLSWLYHLPGFGLALTLGILLLTGVVTANILGQRMLKYWEGWLNRIPLVRSIYGGVKQVSDTVFSGSGQAFNKAVLVRFPHQNAWTVAFLTGTPEGHVADRLPGDYLSVYVPTTPNPTSGYLIMVKREEAIELDMSVDEALKYVISMGVVGPAQAQAD